MSLGDTFWQRWWSILCTGIAWRVHSYCHRMFPQGNLSSERGKNIQTLIMKLIITAVWNKWESSRSDKSNLQRFVAIIRVKHWWCWWGGGANMSCSSSVNCCTVPAGGGGVSLAAESPHWRLTSAPSSGSNYLYTTLRVCHCGMQEKGSILQWIHGKY